jgi:hypothetical protein
MTITMNTTMSTPEGYFVDWDGDVRLTTDPGGGYLCDVDAVAKYVGVTTKTGALVHEATFYKNMEATPRRASKPSWCPAATPGAIRAELPGAAAGCHSCCAACSRRVWLVGSSRTVDAKTSTQRLAASL